MISMKNLNVVKVVATEEDAVSLERKGFVRVADKPASEPPSFSLAALNAKDLKAFAKDNSINVTSNASKDATLASLLVKYNDDGTLKEVEPNAPGANDGNHTGGQP